MSTLLKDMIQDVEIKDPYAIVAERGTGFSPMLLPGHLFALNINMPFAITENMLPLNKHEHNKEKDDKFFINEEPYYDTMPIGLCLKTHNQHKVKILNLSVIPPLYRYKILETYYQVMKSAINSGYEEDLSKEKLPMLDRLKESNYIGPFMGVNTRFIQQITGINLRFAINKYNVDTLKSVKLLDWDSLPEITKMNVSEGGIVFHPGAGRLEGMFNIFESRLS